MSAPMSPPEAPRLPEALHHKVIAVKLQLELFERDLALGQTTARLATLERDAFRATLAPVEAEVLAVLGAAPGSRFDWASMSVVAPPAQADATADA